jgi:spore coat polysaccharide biosynthesis predicted glycosyltransferase SpsG
MVTPEQISNAKIIFSPLNWGMGHVSRSLPLLEQLLNQHNSITVFCSAAQQKIYELYFSNLRFIHHDPYAFSFGKKGFNTLGFIKQLPSLIKQHQTELKRIAEYIALYPTDYIISDQRYGFRSASVCSIFITHQCSLALPWYLGLGQFINRSLIQRFNMTWIMDDEHQRFAGKLSVKFASNQHYIGVKSRFHLASSVKKEEKKLHILVVNGPTEFHPLLLKAFEPELSRIDLIIGARPDLSNNIPCIYSWNEADEVLNQAATIYSFCGYSTLMDVVALGCEWKSIPTPGQWEQGYLHKKTLTEGPGFLCNETSN